MKSQYEKDIQKYSRYWINRYNLKIYILDIQQEIRIKLFTNPPDLNKNSQSSYINRIAHNLCIDYMRLESRLPTINLEDLTPNVNEPSFNPEEEMEITQQIQDVLNSLTKEKRLTLIKYLTSSEKLTPREKSQLIRIKARIKFENL